MGDNILQMKSEDFAVRIVKLGKFLYTKKEFDISRQVKRSGTSIGANTTEALFASSKKDFLAKLYIAYKECNETKYWLRVLHRTEYLTDVEFQSIYEDCVELDKLLTSIIKTTKQNMESVPRL